MMKKISLLFFCALLLAAACTTRDYETGDGKLSFLRADFGVAHSDAVGSLDYVDTDEGQRVFFPMAIQADWAVTADSLYRVLTYYDATETATTSKVHRLIQLVTVKPKPAEEVKEQFTDPVKVESAWMSPNGKYLNLGLRLMTGSTDDEELHQTVGVLLDEETERDDHTHQYRWTFFHNQNGVPEYYSTLVYISIATADLQAGDGITLRINTYDGWEERTFEIAPH
ncbi:MAG: hypothetical protein IKX22_11390 [Prevotella sp.]|nr:hypothetical protein [Prevotella sp.]